MITIIEVVLIAVATGAILWADRGQQKQASRRTDEELRAIARGVKITGMGA
jgi:hypothetical protein